MVDLEDYLLFKDESIFLGVDSRYAMIRKNGKLLYLHRLIMDATENQIVDHIDMNTLDNRKKNLRMATKSQNQANRGKPIYKKKLTSIYKGVMYDQTNRNWIARVAFNNKVMFRGRFKDEKSAVLAYNHYALKYHGEFAKLNDVDFKDEIDWRSNQIKRNKNVKESKYKYVTWTDTQRKWIGKVQSYKYGNSKSRRFVNDYEAVLYCNKYIIENNLHVLEKSKTIQLLKDDDVKLLNESQLIEYNSQLKLKTYEGDNIC